MTTEIRAAVWYGPGTPLRVEPVLLAPPGPDEVEIEIAACAICHSDLAYTDGAWEMAPPAVFGHEAAGRVVQTGQGVTDFVPGDRVAVTLARACGACPDCLAGAPTNCAVRLPLDETSPLTTADGAPIAQGLRTAAFAEKVTLHRSQIVKVPDSLDWATVSVISCGVLTGVGAARHTGGVRPRHRVAVIGVGGVGLNAVQGAKIAGAETILAIDLSAERRTMALAFGATAEIDPSEGDVADAIARLTDGRGLDRVLVCVGSPKVIDGSISMLARGGSVVIVGMPPDGAISHYDPGALANANQSILGSKFGQAVIEDDVPHYCDLYRDGLLQLDELVTGRYGFEDINAALEATRRGEGVRNVVLFDWAREEGL